MEKILVINPNSTEAVTRGIDAAMELRPRPSVVIVLTDGYTPWPAAAPRAATVVVGLLGAVPPLSLIHI